MDPMHVDQAERSTLTRGPDRWAVLLVGAILAVLGGTVAVFFGWYVPSEREAAVQAWSDRLTTTADDREASVDSWLAERLADAACIASFPSVAALVEPSGGSLEPNAPDHVTTILDSEVAAFGYQDGWVVDQAGRVLAAASANRAGDDRLPDHLVASFRETGTKTLMERDPSGALRLGFLAPVAAHGFVVLAADPRDVMFPLLGRESFATRTGESVLVARDGDRIVFLSPLRFSDTPPLELALPWDTTGGLAAAYALAGDRRTGWFEDYRRHPVLAATRRIKASGWGLVQKLDREEVLAGYVAPVRTVGVATAALFLALLGLGYGLWIRRRGDLTARARRSEQRFRATFEQSVVGIAHVNPDGRFLAVNQPMCTLLGYTRQELLLKKLPDVTHPEDAAADRAALARLMSGVDAAWSREKRYVRKDGTAVWVSVTVSPVRNAHGRVAYLITAARDITARKAAEGRATALASIYKALGETNEAIARIPDEEALFQRVCDIVIDLGGPLLAWVGVRDGDRLKPRAAAGALREVVYQLKFDLAPTSSDGNWLACEAFRKGEVLVRNAGPSENGVGWQGRSALRDIVSSVCLPLRRRGAVAGVLAIGSGEAGAFTPDIVALFERMAMNLSFGLDKMAEARDRALAISRLEESVALYRAIARSLPDGAVLIVDRDLRYLMADGGIISEYSRDGRPLEGRLVGEALEPKTAEYITAHFRDALNGKAATYETNLGSRVLWCQYVPVRDASGAVTAAMAVVLDSTRRRKAEDALREHEQEMNDTLQTALDGYCVIDASTRRLLDANPVFCDMHGYSRDELLGMRLPDLQAEESAPEALVSTAEMRQFGRDRILARHRRKDGRPFDVELSLTYHEFGGGRYVAFCRDVTERLRLEAEHRESLNRLQASEERYRSLVENLEDVVFSVDLEGRVTYMSPACSSFGFAVHEVVGRPFAQFVHPNDLPELTRSVEEAFAGRAAPANFRIYDRAGTIHSVRAASRLVVEDGRPAGLTGVLVDLTAQRRVEDQLRLSQKMEAVGRLAGGIAHDFNNLMSVVLSYVGFALESTPEGNPVRPDLEEIRLAAERAANLTKQLLAFSRRQVLDPEQVSLNRVVAGIEGMLRRLIGEDVQLRTTLPPDLGDVRVDPGQIEQVIMNLAVNARDAMPKGGTLTIETSNVELDEEYASRHVAVKPGPYVLLAVTDSGCGMDAATRAQVFEPFFTTKEPGKGTGLGLATTYGIVKQSGGNIWVYSEPGLGTTFKVYLPRHAASAGAGPRPKHGHPGGGHGETILVVEDEVGVRAAAKRILANAGYNVILASGGEEALATCRSHEGSIDLLLTDVVMPGMDGREVAGAVGALFPGIRVLFMSGYAENAIVNEGILDADTNYIAKPFNATDLARRVREILDGKENPGEGAEPGA